MNTDRFTELLNGYKTQAMKDLSTSLRTHGLQLRIFSESMEFFSNSLLELPKETECKAGCAYCCHLRVGTSIPEVLVIFDALKSVLTSNEFNRLKQHIVQTAQKGDTLSDKWWLATRTPCPFLDSEEQNICLIYKMRPFSCRAYHSTEQTICQQGFEKGQEMQIPCFPMYRASIDMYSTVFIQVMANKGLYSYQVGFVRALQILFEDDTATEQWLKGTDVFRAARLNAC